MNNRVKKMVISALMLALCLLLPFLTGQIPTIGSALSPMHIPVFLCGFLCGMPWAPIVGFIAPLLRSVLLGMPPLFPTGICMAFELATYGLVTALLNRRLSGSFAKKYIVLIAAMLCGRIVWGLAAWIFYGLAGNAFTMPMFIAGAFTNAVPGIICHIAVIPPLVHAMSKTTAPSKDDER